MSLEGNRRKERKSPSGFVKGAAFGAALLAAGATGVEKGASKFLERINEHTLTPRTIQELKEETGATDKDIARLEARLSDILRRELKTEMSKKTSWQMGQ